MVKRKINGYTPGFTAFKPPRKVSKGRKYIVAKRTMPTIVPGYTRASGFYGRFTGRAGELKFHDIDVDDASIAINSAIQNSGTINIIAQGTAEDERLGRKCTVKRIMFRYNLTLPVVTDTPISETVRMIVYLDTQCNGATATASGVTGILTSDNYQSYNNLANSQRFRILYDRLHFLAAPSGAGNGTANDFSPYQVNGSFYKKCDIPLEFNSTTGALTEIRSNNICVMTVSKIGSLVALDGKIRLRFADQSG